VEPSQSSPDLTWRYGYTTSEGVRADPKAVKPEEKKQMRKTGRRGKEESHQEHRHDVGEKQERKKRLKGTSEKTKKEGKDPAWKCVHLKEEPRAHREKRGVNDIRSANQHTLFEQGRISVGYKARGVWLGHSSKDAGGVGNGGERKKKSGEEHAKRDRSD